MSVEGFFLTFVPLFVATDPVGLVPFYLTVGSGRDPAARRRILWGAVLTALVVGTAFLFIGEALLGVLGVTVDDFKVAGGLLLLVVSVRDIVAGEQAPRAAADPTGAVPLGVPLIAGPAVVTSLIMLSQAHGHLACLVSYVGNLALVVLAFWQGEKLIRLLGKAVTGATSKVASLLLAAYAVMMIRQGIVAIVSG